jgi:hypothetical protein
LSDRQILSSTDLFNEGFKYHTRLAVEVVGAVIRRRGKERWGP